jgi:NAD(P)-dependent dehydrogenase (short-subunit alcohol dehydrogenase family)
MRSVVLRRGNGQVDQTILVTGSSSGFGRLIVETLARRCVMVVHVRERFPEVVMRTENAGANAPMLAINHEMGYREYRSKAEYQLDVDHALRWSVAT